MSALRRVNTTSRLTLFRAFEIGMLAATAVVLAFGGPLPVSAQTNSNSAAAGVPTISGTAAVGETLTVDTSGISDADGLDNVSYTGTWYANEPGSSTPGGSVRVLIAAGADLSYTVQPRDAGKTLKIQVFFTDDAGNDESLTSASTATVPSPPAGSATGFVTFEGIFLVGSTLDAVTYGISDPDGLTNATYSYQWLADDTEIDGATSSSYTLQVSDAGRRIKLQVTFTDDANNEESLTSAASPAVSPRNFRATGTPAISGAPPQVGQTLTASTSGIADRNGLTNPTYSYQWISNDGTTDTEIEGATSSTYRVQASDNGKTIKVQVTFTDDQGFSESLTSEATSAVVIGGL